MYHDLYQIACYQLVSKRFILSFSCPQTIYLDFFAFENNFFRIFYPPLQKNNGPSLITGIKEKEEKRSQGLRTVSNKSDLLVMQSAQPSAV